MAPAPRISRIGDTATLTSGSLRSAILPLIYDVPKPPIGPVPSALPTIRGTVAPIWKRFVSPRAASTIGTSTSLRSAPDQRIAEIVSDIDPAGSRLASSIQESSDVAVEGPGNGL